MINDFKCKAYYCLGFVSYLYYKSVVFILAQYSFGTLVYLIEIPSTCTVYWQNGTELKYEIMLTNESDLPFLRLTVGK